jgi:hypothetical protein
MKNLKFYTYLVSKGQNSVFNFAFEWDYSGLFDENKFVLNPVRPNELFQLDKEVNILKIKNIL